MAAVVIFSGHAGSFLAPFQGPRWSQGPLRDHRCALVRCLLRDVLRRGLRFVSFCVSIARFSVNLPAAGHALPLVMARRFDMYASQNPRWVMVGSASNQAQSSGFCVGPCRLSVVPDRRTHSLAPSILWLCWIRTRAPSG